MNRSIVRLRFAAAAAALLLASCTSIFGPGDSESRDLAAAKVAWAAHRLDSYTLVVRPMCFCGSPLLRVTVVNGVVTSREFIGEAAPVPPSFFSEVESVDAMLSTLERAVEDASDVEAEYDTRGVPQHASIDWYANAIDDEFGWTVVELTPAP